MANRLKASTRPYRMAARAESAQANGERIVAVARDLFAERLFDQVLLEDVAARAGVTVRTVVRRFGSKEHLFALVAAERARLIRGERDETLPGDVPGAVRTLIESYERWGDEVLHLLAQERRADAIAKGVRAGRGFHRAWVDRVFSPLLKDTPSAQRKRRLAQLTAVTDVYTWKVLRRDLGLSRHEAEGSVRELIDNIVARRSDSMKAWAG
ncbi:MAG TPA: helix-turn-helix domain-containing protein [Candidatus Dormibacteraeota bacterium]|nr:helix-turn-helix domain-containing protein [Candidatus Dormibacteraeota bacterium]